MANETGEGAEISYTWDYGQVPEPRRQFVMPHAAQGPTVHRLTVKEGGFEMPVSLHIEDGGFYITGVQDESNLGAIISGTFSGDSVKINHIDTAKALRGKGVGPALLAVLEEQLKSKSVKMVYAAFGFPGTVGFFIKNEYTIVPVESLNGEQRKALDIDPDDFDHRISSAADFEALAAGGVIDFKKILLVKEVENKQG